MTEDFTSLESAKKYLQEIIYLTLSTCSKGCEPWCSPVYTAYITNPELTFYWCSSPASQHSKNIYENPQSFAVIYNSLAPEGTGEGLYLKGVSKVVQDSKELDKALEVLAIRCHGNKVQNHERFIRADALQRIYKFIPEKAWVNGVVNEKGVWVDKRQKISVKDLL